MSVGIARSLRLLREGQDTHAPASVLKISAARACRKLAPAPYSIAENLAHAYQWQRHWLAKLGVAERMPGSPIEWDWLPVAEAEWPEVRRGFLQGLDQAIEFAERVGHEEQAEFVLNQILIHDAYHLGQCVLLKRLMAAQARQS